MTKVPITVKITGEILDETDQLKILKLEQPIRITYEIQNLSDDHIFECASFLDVQSNMFYASGDVRSSFELMPLETFELHYILLPL